MRDAYEILVRGSGKAGKRVVWMTVEAGRET